MISIPKNMLLAAAAVQVVFVTQALAVPAYRNEMPRKVDTYGPPLPPGYIIPDDDELPVDPAAKARVVEEKAEVILSKASIELNAGRYREAIATLKKVLGSNPDHTQALELTALAHRKLQDNDGAIDAYTRLSKTAPDARRPAYEYELGSLFYGLKRKHDARVHFEKAASGNFNPGMSHFLAGLIQFENKEWRSARHHFTASLTYSDAGTVAPIASYYLANTYAQLGKTDAAIRTYTRVSEDTSAETKGTISKRANANLSPMVDDIRSNALKELRTFDTDQKYLSLSLLSQYDSNVQTNPNDSTSNPDVASMQKSAKALFVAAVGYSSSPMKTWQYAPSYRLYTNYNFNSLARDFNFLSHTPGLFVLHRPYERFSTGLKAEGTYSMKNTPTAGSRNSVKYNSFSLTGDIGPVAKYELTPRIGLAGELTWWPKKYYTDPETGDSRRSGNGAQARITADFLSAMWWWSPVVYLGYELDQPSGKLFQMNAFGGGLANSVSATEKLTFTPGVDYTWTSYGQTANPQRKDSLFSARLAASYTYDPKWTINGDVGYTRNGSTQATSYSYRRFVISAGASYLF